MNPSLNKPHMELEYNNYFKDRPVWVLYFHSNGMKRLVMFEISKKRGYINSWTDRTLAEQLLKGVENQ